MEKKHGGRIARAGRGKPAVVRGFRPPAQGLYAPPQVGGKMVGQSAFSRLFLFALTAQCPARHETIARHERLIGRTGSTTMRARAIILLAALGVAFGLMACQQQAPPVHSVASSPAPLELTYTARLTKSKYPDQYVLRFHVGKEEALCYSNRITTHAAPFREKIVRE